MEPVLAESDDAGVAWTLPRPVGAELIGGPDLREGVASFRAGRTPRILPLEDS